MNDLLAAHGITEGNILQFLAVLTYIHIDTKLILSELSEFVSDY